MSHAHNVGPEKTQNEPLQGWRGVIRAFATPAAGVMFFLGFGSGLPFLLVGVTLGIWLREAGVSLVNIGLISIASWFYLVKFLWAPLLDRFPLPFLGRRRGWLLISQMGVAICLAALALIGPVNEVLFIALITAASFFGATQDIVVDAYRIEIGNAAEQAALASVATLGYRIGLIAAGVGALYTAEAFNWQIAYFAMAALMLVPLIATILAAEPAYHAPTRRINVGQSFTEPFVDFFSRFGAPMALGVMIFVGLSKFPDQVIGTMAGPFYLDSGFTKADIATVSKLFGVWIGIGGAMLGGAGAAIFGIRRMLLVGVIAVGLSNLAFLAMAYNPGELWAFYLAISADNLSQGFGGVVLVAFISTLTSQQHTATQFALLGSLAFLPGKMASAVAGYWVESLGYASFFVVSSFTVLPALLLLLWLWPRIGPKSLEPTVSAQENSPS